MDEPDKPEEGDSLLREIAAAPAVPVPRALAGQVLVEAGTIVDGMFRIEARLGSGGMGVVYAARDLKLDREVALKLMRFERGGDTIGRRLPEVFEREARATARLNHPNVVTLHQFGDWNGVLYLVLERLHGETLEARLQRGALPLVETVAIAEQVAVALAHTHAAGVVHRDLKPSNVFLLAGGVVKVLDFGVSGVNATAVAGTPGYMAPEQHRGEPQDVRTDLWALGAMLYQMIAGTLPFGDRDVGPDDRPPRLDVALPPEAEPLVGLVATCLQPRAERRPAGAAEVAGVLRNVRDALTSDASAPSSPLPTARVARRRPSARRAVIGVGLVAGLAAAAFVARDQRGGTRDACARSGQRIASSWSAAVRARFAAPAWSTSLPVLDGYASQWTTLREAACRDRSRAAERCLDDRLAAFEYAVAHLDPDDPAGTEKWVGGLTRLSDCASPEFLTLLDRGPAEGWKGEGGGAGGPVATSASIGGAWSDMVHAAIAIGGDGDGDVVMTGFVGAGSGVLGVAVDAPTGARTGFVARVHDGRVRWLLPGARALALAAGERGDVLVAGFYRDGARLGDFQLPAIAASQDCFVASLDRETGAVHWVRTCGASRLGQARTVAVDTAGNVYVAGDFAGTARFGGETPRDAGATSTSAPFVASWSGDGTLRWVTTGQTAESSRSRGLAVAGDAVVVGGQITRGGSLGDRTLAPDGCFVARLAAASGSIVWLRELEGARAGCEVAAVAADGDRVAAGGADWQPSEGAWVAELALADGTERWRRQLATGRARVLALAYGPDGLLAAAGRFAGTELHLDDVALENRGRDDGFVVRLDGDGRAIDGLGIGGPSEEVVRSLDHGPGGRLWIAGRFESDITVAGHTLTWRGYPDGFLLELTPPLGARSPVSPGSSPRPRPPASAGAP
ncbi:MAG TPA: protein kinase [Kofleriaceae bacterium]|nr:protein kinase [Kofleriaceae bacterium]